MAAERNPNRRIAYGDWRDRLVQQPYHEHRFRLFESLKLGECLNLSAQNSPFAYVSGRHLTLNGADAFDYDRLADFEVAFWLDEDEGLMKFAENPVVRAALDAVGIGYNEEETVIGYVTAAQVGALIERLGGLSPQEETRC